MSTIRVNHRFLGLQRYLGLTDILRVLIKRSDPSLSLIQAVSSDTAHCDLLALNDAVMPHDVTTAGIANNIEVTSSTSVTGVSFKTLVEIKPTPSDTFHCNDKEKNITFLLCFYFYNLEQSTCVGDGAHLSVFFGNNPTLTADTSITIANTKNPIKNTTKVEPEFTVVFPSKVISCMKNVIVEVKQITGNGKKNLTFHWEIIYGNFILIINKIQRYSPELSKLVAANHERILSFPSHMLTKPISIIVTGCNFIGKCKKSRNCHLQPINDIAFLEVLLSGVSDSTPPSIPIRLRATPQFTRCNATETIVPDEVQV
uniref:Tectonic-3 n=1 Tax=Heterorhabditis bacteriophora TaxID=37862 RepID=A0A1I7WD04_HETBA